MTQLKKGPIATLLVAAIGAAAGGTAAQDKPIRIGVLNDQSSVYADFQGRGSVLAAQMAVEEYGGRASGRGIEVAFADNHNKPDAGSVVERQRLDQKRAAHNRAVRDSASSLTASASL